MTIEWLNAKAYIGIALSNDRTVCVIDYRGMGLSKLPPSTSRPMDLTLVQIASDVFDILLELGWYKFQLLGHSFGGLIALELCLLLRGRDDFECRALTLMSTSAKINSQGPLARFVYSTVKSLGLDVSGRGLLEDYKLTKEQQMEFSKGIFQSCLESSSNSNPDQFMSRPRSLWVTEQQLDIQQNLVDLAEQLPFLLGLPCLFIVGLKDTVIDLMQCQAIGDPLVAQDLTLHESSHW